MKIEIPKVLFWCYGCEKRFIHPSVYIYCPICGAKLQLVEGP